MWEPGDNAGEQSNRGNEQAQGSVPCAVSTNEYNDGRLGRRDAVTCNVNSRKVRRVVLEAHLAWCPTIAGQGFRVKASWRYWMYENVGCVGDASKGEVSGASSDEKGMPTEIPRDRTNKKKNVLHLVYIEVHVQYCVGIYMVGYTDC